MGYAASARVRRAWILILFAGLSLTACGPQGSSVPEVSPGQRGGPPPPPTAAVVEVSAAVFSPDNRHLITGHSSRMMIGGQEPPEGKILQLWDVDSGKPLGTLEGHERGITGVAFLPDGKRAVSASRDGTLKLWDVANRTVIRTLESKDDAPCCIAVSRDGTRALTGGFRGGLSLWDVVGGKLIRSFRTATQGQILSLAFSPDSKRILLTRGIGGIDERGGSIYILDSSDGGVLLALGAKERLGSPTAAFSADGSLLAAIRRWGEEAGNWQHSLDLVDATSGKIVHEFEKRVTPAWAIAFVPGGPPWRILTADADFHITLWDGATGRQIWSVPVDSFVWAFSPDRTLAVSAQGGDAVDIHTGRVRPGLKLKVWDTAHGKLFRTLLDADADRLREIQEKERARRGQVGEPQ
jgi:WD40 repeat protein